MGAVFPMSSPRTSTASQAATSPREGMRAGPSFMMSMARLTSRCSVPETPA